MKRIILLLALFIPFFTISQIINIPEDYSTIQQGIDAAQNGDTVVVDKGTYFENINFKGKAITVTSHFMLTGETSYIQNTIIDGSQFQEPDSASVVYFISEESFNSVLNGFTITNGSGTYVSENEAKSGGGIFCTYSSPTLLNLIIDGNTAYAGAGILGESSEIRIFNSSIRNNKSFCEVGGGAMFINSNPYLQNVKVCDNKADWGAGIYLEESNGKYINIELTNNNGGAGGGMICAFNCNPEIVNSTLANNSAIMGGGIACVHNSNPSFINSIIWSNTPEQVFFTDEWSSNSISFSFSSIEGGEEGIVTNDNGTCNWLEGNIDQDPIFVYSGDHPYQVNDYSPCIDAGTQDTAGLNLPEYDLAGEIRIDNERVDMGAYEWNTMVGVEDASMPQHKLVRVNKYPNPFSTSITIEYSLNQPQTVTITFYNQFGKQVDILRQDQSQGLQEVVWTPENLVNGVYYFRLQAGEQMASGKMVLMR